MDPLTITSTVISISARCVQTARALYDLRGKYKDASMLITAIYTETTVISTSLASIQGLCTRNPEALRSTLHERSDLTATFDQALTGCVLVYSVLDEEVHRLYAEIGKDGIAGAMGRMKFVWKEDTMKDVLTQIRGQQTALSLLIQLLQMGSIQDVQVLLQNNTAVLQNVAYQTGRFRRANPKVKAPASVFEVDFDDVASIYTTNSAATSTNFAFDDLVVNSQAYRRALFQTKSSQNLTPVMEQSEMSSDSATIVDGRMPDEDVQHLVKEHEILREKYQKVKRYFFEQQTQVHRLQNEKADIIQEMETLKEEKEAELSRVLAERDDIEQSRSHLEEESKRHSTFFRENDAKRKVLIERHEADRKALSERFEAQLKSRTNLLEALQNEIKGLEETTQTKSKEITELKKNIEETKSKAAEHEKNLQDVQDLRTQKAALEEELQRYRSLDPIIEQLRLLSPKLPSSPSRNSVGPGNVGNYPPPPSNSASPGSVWHDPLPPGAPASPSRNSVSPGGVGYYPPPPGGVGYPPPPVR
ncbi:hypothetical protein BCR34DRAFT_555977 [Clohesyomyces aquaticus]|uniref:Uncharacterized protein n=1 Tax=Clohesyomyces aquaticus TaxID=1231657 RepID=A0A1Y2A405_9PLEO|nr:hypothetical protein BCR34DRAFT_555977 [Clohesyomyces aquaticus]